MAGDGVSLQTTISQLGNVAKTQLKGQQGNPNTTPLSEQVDQSKDLKVNRVKQADKAEKNRVQSEEEENESRARRRQRKGRERRGRPDSPESEADPQTVPDEDCEDVGVNIDTMA